MAELVNSLMEKNGIHYREPLGDVCEKFESENDALLWFEVKKDE